MADKTKIEWADATWNVVTGCSITSPGCTNCYAMRLAGTRLREHPSRKGLTKVVNGKPVWTGEVRFNEQWLTQPLRWKRPRKIFVCAHSDLFHENVPTEWIDRVFAVMALAPWHTFMVLTKRSKRMRNKLSGKEFASDIRSALNNYPLCEDSNIVLACNRISNGPLPNIMLGVTAEDQERADERIPDLLETPATKRFVSIEPMLGPVDLENIKGEWSALDSGCDDGVRTKQILDLVIVGGESGPGARPMHHDWARSVRDQCAAANVPFFFKQWGEWMPIARGIVTECYGSGVPSVAWPDGTITHGNALEHGGNGFLLDRVGKARAGRLLDGIEHNELP